ncbi:MAG TPA: nuclear transport factor 2 family protein [Trebonia sp.]
MTETIMDRYIRLFDAAVHDASALDEMLTLFAPEATVEIGQEPVQGRQAIDAMYRAFVATFSDSKHFCNTTVLEDGSLLGEWVASGRTTDNRVITAAGVERVKVDGAGRITDLRNEFTRVPG